MTITEALIAEHVVFSALFDQAETLLRQAATLAEIKMLSRMVEGLLLRHRNTETNLAYLALDHALAERGSFERLYQEHKEIDDRLAEVQTARSLDKARHLLRAALATSREHFRNEEEHVFPLIEKVLQNPALTTLGQAWSEHRVLQTQ